MGEVADKGDLTGHYFETIDAALAGLDLYLRDVGSPFYKHELTGSILAGYILRLRHSFEAWRNRVAFAEKFRISQAESGYPVFQNVLDLDLDAKNAEQRLAELPEADALKQDMIDYILRKRKFPTSIQRALARRFYLEEVRKGAVFQPHILPETVKLSSNPKSGRLSYVTHWGTFDGTANLPMVYVAVLEDSAGELSKNLLAKPGVLKDGLDIPFPIEGLLNPDIAHQFDDFAEKNSAYGLTLSTIAQNMDRDFENLHPVQLRRFIMGPFYSTGVTRHGAAVEAILDEVRDPAKAWMLTWTLQEVWATSEIPGKRGLWSSRPAKQIYHIETDDLEATRMGVSSYEKHALVPHDAYQAIYASGKRDEIFGGYKTHIISGSSIVEDY